MIIIKNILPFLKIFKNENLNSCATEVENWHLEGVITLIGKDFGEFQWKLNLIWPTF